MAPPCRECSPSQGASAGAKLALGLSRLLGPDELTVAVNTGDDETFHGLHVSPDVDTVVYALAGLTNPDTGWGIGGATRFRALEALGQTRRRDVVQVGRPRPSPCTCGERNCLRWDAR